MKIATLVPKLAALALAVASVTANAVSTYVLDFEGISVHIFSSFECTPPGPGLSCDPAGVVSPFTGTLTLTTPDGDGTFTYDGSTSPGNLTLTLNQFGQSSRFELGIPPDPFFGAVISGGQVAALTGSALLFDDLPPAHWLFDGLTLTVNESLRFHEGPTFSNAVITAAVPEPETWMLLIAGLGFVSVARRKSRRASA